MSLKRPALDPSLLEPRSTSGYPEPFRSRVLPREKRALGDPLGLTKIGVNLTTLLPGKESAVRHHHSHEDELVFVLEGEVVLHTDAGEQILTAGTCAGFPAGGRDGHHLINRSDKPARYLEISNRHPDDSAEYPDDDLGCHKGPDGRYVFTHKDGKPYAP
ncbi:MAG TPA: cupin domain-containing protein [Polyangiaceae bacterium]|nr:cupin domain-containing protein [Polyangiaceae bacterium]